MGTYTGAITLVSVSDGASGSSNVYSIQASPVALYKDFLDENTIQYSNAENITYYVFKTNDSGHTELLSPNSDYDSNLEIVTGGHTYSNIWSCLNGLKVDLNGTIINDALSDARINYEEIVSGNLVDAYVRFNINNFLAYTKPASPSAGRDSDYNKLLEAQTQLRGTNCAIMFRVYNYQSGAVVPLLGDLLVSNAVISQFNTTEHMAQFALTTGKMQVAINNSLMEFAETGLQIYGTGLEIFDTNNINDRKSLLRYDTTTQSLHIEGSGTFSGNIYADSGYFTGDVVANSFNGSVGTVCSFHMEEDGLYSNDWHYIYNKTNDTSVMWYVKTSDTEIVSGREYFINTGTSDNPVYTLVNDPQLLDLPNYYVHISNGKTYYENVAQQGEPDNFQPVENPIDADINNYYEQSISANIELLGAEGAIYAKNIYLGTGAQIEEYIKLGNAYIRNPDIATGRTFIESGSVRLTDEGLLYLGSLVLNGNASSISGSNWKINDGDAYFNNVRVSGVISTTVFEQDRIQAVGGSMIFKPSYHVESISGNVVTVDTVTDLPRESGEESYIITVDDSGNYSAPILITNADVNLSNLQITLPEYLPTTDTSIDSGKTYYKLEDNTYVVVSNPVAAELDQYYEHWSYTGITSIVNIGPDGTYILAANSGRSALGRYAAPSGFGIVEFDSSSTDIKPQVFIGNLDDLSALTGIQASGWGLYGQNVYLTGSLTTLVDPLEGYAGINTENDVTATKFGDSDTSEIVFWAGSDSAEAADIRDAKFQVTQHGSMYAAQGVFEGAILTNSTIEGASIRTAKIFGSNTSDYGLGIFDTNDGIAFGTVDNNDIETINYILGLDGFRVGSDNFITIDNGNVDFIGRNFYVQLLETEQYTNLPILQITNNSITALQRLTSPVTTVGHLTFGNDYIVFGNNNVNITIDNNSNNKEIAFTADQTKLQNTIYFDTVMQYKKTSSELGYDLYIGTES